jgi:hypothetical protein
VATVNTSSENGGFGGTGDLIRDASCELRNASTFIGGATDRRVIPEHETIKRSLSMNGGANITVAGTVSLWCNSQNGANETVEQAQIMIVQVGSFF